MDRERLTRRESQARTRAQLLDAAEGLFVRKGFLETTLASIAAEAGLTKGAVYSNFENKEDLFLALMARDEHRHVARHTEQAMPALLSRKALRWRLEEYGRRASSFRRSRARVALFFEYHVFALRNPAARQYLRNLNRTLFASLGREFEIIAEREGLRLEVSGAQLAVLDQALFDGLFLLRALDPGLVPPELFGLAYRLLGGAFIGSDDGMKATTTQRRRS